MSTPPPMFPPPGSRSPGSSPATPKSGCRKAATWGCGIGGGLALLAALLVGLGYLWVEAADEVALVEADRRAVVTMAHFERWFDGWEYTPALEEWEKLRYFDDSWEISYSYDSPEGEDPIYLQSSLSREPEVGDAKFGYLTIEAAMRASLSLFAGDDIEVVERPDLMSWGDESSSYVLQGEVGPVGNLFVARKGRRVVLFLCAGVQFDDADAYREFLGPVLEQAESHVFEGEIVEP